MSFHIISAIDSNKGIGKGGNLPWKLKSDLIHFSKTTKGNGNNTVIMGRKTWDSIGNKCLPNRINIVISTTLINEPNNNNNNNNRPDYIFNTIDDAVAFCKNSNYSEHWIIGGEQIYKSFLELDICKTIVLTVLDSVFECDTFFPMELCREKMDIVSVDKFDTKTDIRAEVHILKNIRDLS